MVNKAYWRKPITEFTRLVKQEKEKRMIEILSTPFEVFPKVFSPVYSSDTMWFAEKMIPLAKNKKFLEIGSGSGVIACLAAIHGAIQVVATDINPNAVNNITANAKRHFLSIDAREGSVFDPILHSELFDVIFWNHPFYCLDEEISDNDMVSLSVYDTDYRFLKQFFLNGKMHLERNGQLILGTSNVARINLIRKFAKDTGYNICLLEKITVPVFKEKKNKMDLRLYSFMPVCPSSGSKLDTCIVPC